MSELFSYLLAGLSDHSPFEMCVILSNTHEPECWRLALHWIGNPKVHKMFKMLSLSYPITK